MIHDRWRLSGGGLRAEAAHLSRLARRGRGLPPPRAEESSHAGSLDKSPFSNLEGSNLKFAGYSFGTGTAFAADPAVGVNGRFDVDEQYLYYPKERLKMGATEYFFITRIALDRLAEP